ncbi:DUF1294 domain-containing protein [Streptococcus castoreus]|uniref:DUF1294 domain-containing protein n=1 Tax=Streptococcus castoreus TaxID=254786 RepID=UPI0004065ACD|nr:DUF1294 domain-containing protein [Streptococcus castoreus]
MLISWFSLLMVWNCVVFGLYALDKYKAVRGQWRISEKTLLIASLICGGFGAFLAGKLCHHKTTKWYFILIWYMGILLTFLVSYVILRELI